MKKYRHVCFILSLLISVHGFPTLSAAQPQPPPLSRADAALIAEAYHLRDSLADKLWPGWSEITVPFLYITADYEYAIDFRRPLSGFLPLGKDPLILRPVQVRKRTLPPNLSASFDIEGISAVVIGTPETLEKSPGGWVLTSGHEMFHVLQAARQKFDKVAALKLGPETDASWQLDFPFPYKDSDVMNLIHLQSYPIYLALTDSTGETVKYNAGTAIEAIRVYKSFLRSLATDDQYYKYSQLQEWAEGIAFYTEYKLAEAAASDAYQPTEAFRQLDKFTSYKQVWADEYKNRLFLTKHAGRAARSRTAFYHLGLGKGLLLDLLMADWKARYFAPGVWVNDLLMTALGQPVELLVLKAGAITPDFKLATTNGDLNSLSQYRGKIVLLNFWEPWCPPCVQEIPHLKALQEKYKSHGLVVLGITSGKDHEGSAKLGEFLRTHKLNYPTLLDQSRTGALYNVKGYPHVFLIDRNGRLVFEKTGYQTGDEVELEKVLQDALSTDGPRGL